MDKLPRFKRLQEWIPLVSVLKVVTTNSYDDKANDNIYQAPIAGQFLMALE